MIHKNWIILGVACLLFAALAEASSDGFSVLPKTLAYSYSEKDFFLPKVEVSAGSHSIELHPYFECLPEFECLSDYCVVPSNLFLVSGEVKQLSIECSLPDLNRSFGGRVVFTNEIDSEFVDIFVFPNETNLSFIPSGAFSSDESFGELILFYILAFLAFILFAISLFTKKMLPILLFGLDILLLFLFF